MTVFRSTWWLCCWTVLRIFLDVWLRIRDESDFPVYSDFNYWGPICFSVFCVCSLLGGDFFSRSILWCVAEVDVIIAAFLSLW